MVDFEIIWSNGNVLGKLELVFE